MMFSTLASATCPICPSVKLSVSTGTTASAVTPLGGVVGLTYWTVNTTLSASNPVGSIVCDPVPAMTSGRFMICSIAFARFVSSGPDWPASNTTC
jgi:hypothetical protein